MATRKLRRGSYANRKRKHANEFPDEEPPTKRRKIDESELDTTDDDHNSDPEYDPELSGDIVYPHLTFYNQFKHKYLSSSISLRTTYESIKEEFLFYYQNNVTKTKPTVKLEKNERGQILAQIQNIISAGECEDIIEKSESLEAFQDLAESKKFPRRIRKSDRLIVVDKKMAHLLETRLMDLIKNKILWVEIIYPQSHWDLVY